MLWTSSVIYLVTPLLWLVKTPADMNELRDLHSSALILIASKNLIIMAMLVIRRGFRTLVLDFEPVTIKQALKLTNCKYLVLKFNFKLDVYDH